MKTTAKILGIAAIATLTYCAPKEDPKTEPETVVVPVPVEEKAPPSTTTVIIEKPAEPATPVEDDGTSVKVDGSGVQVKSKTGGKVTNVGISRDSTSFEVKRPR